ncbi:hypothetical protein F5884DRAFT_764523 [Xylogone sp. PMI_703]|nr:hypothetical protein F5884DRAFT_764523 [Xylogone sp. PMI_703]
MPSKLPRVLRLPRLDHAPNSDSEFVLLQVTSAGTKPLDIKLIGTENTGVFAVSLKHNRISTLKTKGSPCDDEEWSAILSYLFLGTAVDDKSEESVQNVEAVAKVDGDEKPMSVIIQKRIEGITQRLGTISLEPKDPDDEPVDIFEWCGIALQTISSSTHELDALKHKFKTQEDEINKLKTALDDLIKAKEAHDAEMLEKFALLLNEKKLKIRDQQRLLAGAKIDPEKARSMKNKSKGVPSHQPLASRSKKRKAGARDPAGEEEEGETADKMDVDNPAEEVANDVDDSEVDRETENETDEETEGSDLDADEASSITADPQRGLIGASIDTAGEDSGREKAKGKEREQLGRSTRKADERLTPPPPRRDMPFAMKKSNGNNKAPPPPPADEGSETESEDEL